MLGNLDKSQEAFCLEPKGSIRLLAPAGSGKTYSLLWRCLALSQKATSKEKFLIFTFTRVARDALMERIHSVKEFQSLQNLVEVTTLNAWGNRYLKNKKDMFHKLELLKSNEKRCYCIARHLQYLWKDNHERIKVVLTQGRNKSQIERELMDLIDAFKSMGFRHDKHKNFKDFSKHITFLSNNDMGDQILASIEKLKNLEVIEEPEEILSPEDRYKRLLESMFSNWFKFWVDACQHMYDSSLITFEDQKYLALIELEKNIQAGKYTTGMHRYHHIFVDEFQDINLLDLNLLKVIIQVNKSEMCIIGDDDQAIYEWRGATPSFILYPEKHIGADYITYILEKNYRSPRNIIQISQKLIAYNTKRVKKSVEAHSTLDAKIDILLSPTVYRTIDWVVSEVKKLLDNPDIGSIGIIGRTRSQIIPYQIVFAGEELPFFADADLHVFFSEAFNELKDLLIFIMQADKPFPSGPDPIDALLKLCDKVQKFPLSKDNRQRFKAHLTKNKPRTINEALELLPSYDGPLKNSKSNNMLTTFYKTIRSFLKAKTVADAIKAVSNFKGFQKNYGQSLDDIFYADPPFTFLSEYAERYGKDYLKFYEDIEKTIATLEELNSSKEDEDNVIDVNKSRLHLMTAYRAKGKEFDVVIVLDCNQMVWPNRFAKNLEAERRLFYVAVTRVKQRLILMVNEWMLGRATFSTPYLSEMGLADKQKKI